MNKIFMLLISLIVGFSNSMLTAENTLPTPLPELKDIDQLPVFPKPADKLAVSAHGDPSTELGTKGFAHPSSAHGDPSTELVTKGFAHPSSAHGELVESMQRETTTDLPSSFAKAPADLPFGKKNKKNKKQKLINFDFENEDLSAIINKFAALENINIILPYGANAIDQKITFKLDKKITLQEAERYLDTFLDLAGYNKIPHGDFYMIVKNEVRGDKNLANLEPLPLYIGVAPDQLPESGRIRVVYYFRNIKVPTSNTGNDPLHAILNDMLSSTQSYSFDSKSNGIIIADKASNIKAVMSMLLELDSMGIRDIIRQQRLFNTSAATVADLLQKQIIAVSGDQQGRIRADVKSEAGLYFAPGTKIIADNRTNSLIIMGKEPAVERVMEFVQEYVDIPIGTGKSILHYYDLQYLDSESFAGVLTKIVAAQAVGESGQATAGELSGPNRFFDGVIIVAEKLVTEKITEAKLAELKKTGATTGVDLKGTVQRGGNRIIVAARNRDWQRIEKLIHDLDKPQLQVIIQVMIVDFTVNENKLFGTQTRNPSLLNLPPGVNFQTSFLAPAALPTGSTTGRPLVLNTPPTTLATDLLMLLGGSGVNSVSMATAITSQPAGVNSLILSLNDPNGSGIWSFLQWLNTFGETNILSNPYIVTLNNRKGEEVVSTIKRALGPANTGEGGVLAAKFMDVEAALRIAVVPRASSTERVNLQISVAINNFVSSVAVGPGAFNSTTRELHTNVNMGSGQMLVLGGLTQSQETEDEAETPLLGRIPIIGWFFKQENQATVKTNVSVFIIPTIVEPKIRAGMNKYTRDKVDQGYTLDETEIFSQLRDPVNYLFFSPEAQSPSAELMEEYLSESKGDWVQRNKTRGSRKPCSTIAPEPPLPEHESYCRLPATPSCHEKACSPEKEDVIITPESDKLKNMLAQEENPILRVNP
jgi:general secretion pathway protein D